ncbi:MAG: hypothetical protein LBS74_08430 [Oscillospiraceae bacterium]|jgi:hypothetical protein|nr:hypothetical protein [Oscillospiraceae bacterium]
MDDASLRQSCVVRTPVSIKCEYCGTVSPHGDKACSKCGAALNYTPQNITYNEWFDQAKYETLKSNAIRSKKMETSVKVTNRVGYGCIITIVSFFAICIVAGIINAIVKNTAETASVSSYSDTERNELYKTEFEKTYYENDDKSISYEGVGTLYILSTEQIGVDEATGEVSFKVKFRFDKLEGKQETPIPRIVIDYSTLYDPKSIKPYRIKGYIRMDTIKSGEEREFTVTEKKNTSDIRIEAAAIYKDSGTWW